jgi:LmbE family N-acetylglucosaminyl deacetylase
MTEMATILAFHAHPDDEVLLTGGTLAPWPPRATG